MLPYYHSQRLFFVMFFLSTIYVLYFANQIANCKIQIKYFLHMKSKKGYLFTKYSVPGTISLKIKWIMNLVCTHIMFRERMKLRDKTSFQGHKRTSIEKKFRIYRSFQNLDWTLNFWLAKIKILTNQMRVFNCIFKDF